MSVKVSKSDVVWGYVSQFFNLASGMIVLPLVLHMLSTEEIALNYLMMTIATMVALMDFGFSPQFGRNVTYVFSGVQKLEKEGVEITQKGSLNYHLLYSLIRVARKVYLYLGLIVLAVMLTLGTVYIYYATDGFSTVDNALLVWILFSLSTALNIYFLYYSSLLTGRGLVKESKKALMASKVFYIVLSYILLLSGMGLLGLTLANLIAPFISRFLSYRYFFDEELKSNLSGQTTSKKEIKELFHVIAYNAKKLGINFIGAYAILKFSLFIAGLYLTPSDIASYGLMIQLVTIIGSISSTFFQVFNPQITSYHVTGNLKKEFHTFALSMSVFYLLFLLGTVLLVFFGQPLLKFIGSNALLPSRLILVLYCLIILLEYNHSHFATYITFANEIPFVKSSIITGVIVCLCDFLVLQYTSLGLLGVVLVQGVAQLAYNNWRWPLYVFRKTKTNVFSFMKACLFESISHIKSLSQFPKSAA